MSLLSRLQKYKLRRLHHDRPLEFGDPTRVDRFEIAARIKAARQGAPITTGSPEFDFDLDSAAFMFSKKAIATAFRFAQNNISSPGVLEQLRGTKIIGTVSDSLSPNGLAGKLETSSGLSAYFMNVTARAFFFPLALALHWKSMDEPTGTRRLVQSPLLAKLEFPHQELLLPDSVEACVEAANIARCAFIATIYHEFSHLIRGHTGWLAAQYKHNDFMEVTTSGASVSADYAKWRKPSCPRRLANYSTTDR